MPDEGEVLASRRLELTVHLPELVFRVLYNNPLAPGGGLDALHYLVEATAVQAAWGGHPCELQNGPSDVHAGDELGGLLGRQPRRSHDEGYFHGLLVRPALACEPVLATLEA